MDFERWFHARTSRFEGFVLKSALLLLLLLIITQALLAQPVIRRMLSLVDRMEGAPLAGQEADAPAAGGQHTFVDRLGYVELSILGGADGRGVEIQVNGETTATFADTQTVRVPVRDGDAVEVGGAVPSDDVRIAVTSVSEGIVSPAEGKEITYYGVLETISFVTMERD